MRVTIVGSGNVAEALAQAIERSPVELVQVYGRNRERVEEIYRAIGRGDEVVDGDLKGADIYLIAVSDGAVDMVTRELEFESGSIVAHTAASVSIESINTRKGINKAVFYPLQTFTKGREVEFKSIPIFLEADNEEVYLELEKLASELSERVQRLDSKSRAELHLAAVFSCNFTMAMLTATQDILRRGGLPLELYDTLLSETLSKAFDEKGDIRRVLTGPAVRGDEVTQERHLEMIREECVGMNSDLMESDLLIDMYKIISKYIWETSKRI